MWLRSRAWLNALFWILLILSLLQSLYSTAPGNREIRLSLLVAIAAVWLNLFPRFLQGPKLHSSINQITILSLATGNQAALVADMAIEDLMSSNPSDKAGSLMAGVHGVREAVNARNAARLRTLFGQANPMSCDYRPSDEMIERFITDVRATPAFFVPLVIYNSGAKFGDVSSIVMTAEAVDTPARKWAYAAYMEMNVSALMKVGVRVPDLELLSGPFPGCSVAPGDSVKLNLHFTPIHEITGRRISTTSTPPGDYRMRVLGFGPGGKLVFRTSVVRYPLKMDTLVAAFKNSQWTYYVDMDENIARALE